MPRSRRTAPLCTSGFSLIELIIVIAVTAVIGSMAVSAYRTYRVRSEVAAHILATDAWQGAVERAFRDFDQVPRDRGFLGATAPPEPAACCGRSVEVVDGRIDISFAQDAAPAIAGRRLALTPYETATRAVVWVCGNRIPGPGLKPLGFAGGGRQAVQVPTTIEARYLPRQCR